MLTMELIGGLWLPRKKKSALVKGMFQTLGLKYLNTSGISASGHLINGVRPGRLMYLDKRDLKRLKRHGARHCFLLRDRLRRQQRVLYWGYITLH